MSQANVELVGRLYEPAYGSVEWRAVIEDILSPDIEWVASAGFGVMKGREAVLGFFDDWSGSFDDLRVDAEEMVDAGDDVVVVQHVSGTGRTSGANMDARFAVVFKIHATRIVSAREYATHAEALEAVGLRE